MSPDTEERSTPGPWEWAERRFLKFYVKTDNAGKPKKNRAGAFMAKHRGSLKNSWVYLLIGPKLSGSPANDEHCDEWDYHHVMRLRWHDIKGNSLFNATPMPGDMALIAAAPTLRKYVQQKADSGDIEAAEILTAIDELENRIRKERFGWPSVPPKPLPVAAASPQAGHCSGDAGKSEAGH